MLKKILIWTLISVVSIFMFAGIFIAHEWNAKPFLINNFFNRVALKVAFDSPETLSSLHFLESFGINGHNAELDDASIESSNAMFEYITSEHQILKQYEDEDLNEDEVLSKKIAEYLFQLVEELEPFKFHNYPVNQLFGIQNNFPSFMEGKHQVNSVEDAEFYISRLKKLPKKFSQSLEGIKLRAQKKIIPPRFVINRVVEEMQKFSSTQIEKNILYFSFEKKLNKLEDVDQAIKDDLLTQVKNVISDDVYPAYIEMTRYFKALSDKADDRDGIWKLPNGRKAYQLALKSFTTTDYTPNYIHKIGLKDVKKLQQQILKILKKEGINTSKGFSHSIDTLSKKKRFYYPDNKRGREQILKDYQTIINEIDGGLEKAFNIRAEAKVEVKRIPLFKEKTSPGAYYSSAALDGSRPGIFYANLYDIKATPKYGMRTLAYHEAVPGHHFQISIAQELDDMPFFRKFAPFTAYVEGWALYAERVAWELGFQKDPFDNIGRLQAELFRAVRLVVDTGIHAKKWTRKQAIDYMIKNTGMAESDVISEIERYIVMPGQACAYKVGMMKILELRKRAKNKLKAKFNLADFHDVVLKNGAVPLNILDELIDQYIQAKLSEE